MSSSTADARAGGRFRLVPTSEGHAVTTIELFFDLVFVFAITQVTAFMAEDIGWRSMLRGLVLVALLWWAWCSYAWLGNQARADEGLVRAGVIGAMAAMFAVALAIPEAWGDEGGGLSAPIVLAVALAAVRLVHLAVYAIAAAGDAMLVRTIARTAVPVVVAAALLVVGAVAGGSAQTALWALALAVDYVGVYVLGGGWRLPSARHFAERHGLILIIALGESLIAVGVGVAELPLTVPILVAAMFGLSISVAMWWLYFDVVAPVAEAALVRATGQDRVRLARDSFTYLHFPMIAGIILFALGMKKVAEYVGDTEHHDLGDALPSYGTWALFGGVALYLLAHLAFRLRNIGSVNRTRAVVTVLVLLAPLAVGSLPALAQVGVLAGLLVALVAAEVVLYREARATVRAEARAHH